MKQSELEILAMVECMLLWDRLSQTGIKNKYDTIRDLYKEGKLSSIDYKCDCPFCDYLDSCDKCLWPIKSNGAGDLRCIVDSLYIQWDDFSLTIKERKKAARKVFNMLLKIKMDDKHSKTKLMVNRSVK